MEIVCLSSSLKDFDSSSWRITKSYAEKILRDLELGYKSWLTLDKCIDSSAWNYAKEMNPDQKVNAQGAKNNQYSSQNNSQNNSQKLCTTYNTFKRGESCAFEFNNPGETCVYLHTCSSCRQRGFMNKSHKAFNCRDEVRLNSNQTNNSNSPSATASATAPPVVTQLSN